MSLLNNILTEEGSGSYKDWNDSFNDEGGKNMDRKPVENGTEVIATLTQKNGVDFPIAYASSIDLDDGKNLESVINELKKGTTTAITEEEIQNLFNLFE